jgi:hypothetical protein
MFKKAKDQFAKDNAVEHNYIVKEAALKNGDDDVEGYTEEELQAASRLDEKREYSTPNSLQSIVVYKLNTLVKVHDVKAGDKKGQTVTVDYATFIVLDVNHAIKDAKGRYPKVDNGKAPGGYKDWSHFVHENGNLVAQHRAVYKGDDLSIDHFKQQGCHFELHRGMRFFLSHITNGRRVSPTGSICKLDGIIWKNKKTNPQFQLSYENCTTLYHPSGEFAPLDNFGYDHSNYSLTLKQLCEWDQSQRFVPTPPLADERKRMEQRIICSLPFCDTLDNRVCRSQMVSPSSKIPFYEYPNGMMKMVVWVGEADPTDPTKYRKVKIWVTIFREQFEAIGINSYQLTQLMMAPRSHFNHKIPWVMVIKPGNNQDAPAPPNSIDYHYDGATDFVNFNSQDEGFELEATCTYLHIDMAALAPELIALDTRQVLTHLNSKQKKGRRMTNEQLVEARKKMDPIKVKYQTMVPNPDKAKLTTTPLIKLKLHERTDYVVLNCFSGNIMPYMDGNKYMWKLWPGSQMSHIDVDAYKNDNVDDILSKQGAFKNAGLYRFAILAIRKPSPSPVNPMDAIEEMGDDDIDVDNDATDPSARKRKRDVTPEAAQSESSEEEEEAVEEEEADEEEENRPRKRRRTS